ncbi:hypothetical protein SPI_07431 [Niveomyces insectorum RCEF 264]|uniref:AB hydrolase-1 domain-containing protein n=1 Tax=Niveomyces insectorum RCEF 264 TaxID=1081102 RepID=A0A167PUX6_9HYPO|nr:hypothetical protein SPI_07431 [Niveomyces insectorum RCEF 264]
MASDAKPVVVLIPGAFHKPSVWSPVAERLRNRGYTVLTPPLAVTGDLSGQTPQSQAWKDLAGADALDDAKVVLSELEPFLADGREAVVVSHSYGSVASTAAVYGNTVVDRAAKGLKGGVKSVVNIAGFAYPVREKGIMGDTSEPPLEAYHVLKDEARDIWFSDLTPAAREETWATHIYKTQSRKSFLYFPKFVEADINVPKTYVLCENDQAVPPAFEEHMAKTGQYDPVLRLPCGHEAPFVLPDEVVNIIVQAADR